MRGTAAKRLRRAAENKEHYKFLKKNYPSKVDKKKPPMIMDDGPSTWEVEMEKTMEEQNIQEVGTENMTEEEKTKIAEEAEEVELAEGEEIDSEAPAEETACDTDAKAEDDEKAEV